MRLKVPKGVQSILYITRILNNVISTATTDKTFQKFLRIEYIDFTLLALLSDERMIPKVITFKEPKFREVAEIEIVDRIQWLG